VVGFIPCCSSCCVVVGLGNVRCIGFRSYIIYICSLEWVGWQRWGGGVYVAGEWVQVLMEKRWYLLRCCSCGPKEPVCSLVHCV
jgi:hypothetical protein